VVERPCQSRGQPLNTRHDRGLGRVAAALSISRRQVFATTMRGAFRAGTCILLRPRDASSGAGPCGWYRPTQSCALPCRRGPGPAQRRRRPLATPLPNVAPRGREGASRIPPEAESRSAISPKVTNLACKRVVTSVLYSAADCWTRLGALDGRERRDRAGGAVIFQCSRTKIRRTGPWVLLLPPHEPLSGRVHPRGRYGLRRTPIGRQYVDKSDAVSRNLPAMCMPFETRPSTGGRSTGCAGRRAVRHRDVERSAARR
jgi:hypothetical protein